MDYFKLWEIFKSHKLFEVSQLLSIHYGFGDYISFTITIEKEKGSNDPNKEMNISSLPLTKTNDIEKLFIEHLDFSLSVYNNDGWKEDKPKIKKGV